MIFTWAIIGPSSAASRAKHEQSGIGVRTWICSAGYGLIRTDDADQAIQGDVYPRRGRLRRLGTAGGTHLFSTDGGDGVCAYRFRKQTGEPRTISALAATFPRTPMLVALSADYLKAVTPATWRGS